MSLLKLPRKEMSLTNSSSKYSEMFLALIKRIDEEIFRRLASKMLNPYEKVKMDQKIHYQMIQVLKRLKSEDMIKMKFAANFGTSLETIHMILEGIHSPMPKLDSIIQQLDIGQLLIVRTYFDLGKRLNLGELINEGILSPGLPNRLDPKKMVGDLLQDFFLQKPELKSQFNVKFEEEIEKSKLLNDVYMLKDQKATAIKLSTPAPQTREEYKKEEQFKNVYEFPTVQIAAPPVDQVVSKPPPKKSNIQSRTNDGGKVLTWEDSENPFKYVGQDAQSLKKKINEEFPSLVSTLPRTQGYFKIES